MRKIGYTTIDEYINTFPKNIQDKLKQIRKTIKENLPHETSEAISYQIPVFKLNGKYVIYFAGFKNHVSIYPIPKGPESFRKRVEPYIKGKGTLQFQLNHELPMGVIKKVIKLSYEANLERAGNIRITSKDMEQGWN